MKLSVFTPSNRPEFLGELYDSLVAQTYKDWEWVILINGKGCGYENTDPRVTIHKSTSDSTSIGFYKKTACGLATGDILVEVDHDDLLMPEALEEIAKAFEDPEIGFVYSSNAKLADDFIPYNSNSGWEFDVVETPKGNLVRMKDFEPCWASTFSFIWYLPDHVRCWRKSVYDSIGGHNPELPYLDDQDLLHRTYLTTKIKQIDKALYIYRITGQNNWIKNSADIQKKTVELWNKNAYKIVERWSDLQGLKKLDLGGAFGKPLGYLSVDRQDSDIVCDLNEGIPLPDGSVGVIRAHDFLEHIKDQQKMMAEIWRVLADGGWLMVMVPSTDGRGAFQDPTHVSYWNQNSFWYWTRRDQAKYIRNDKIRFQDFRLETIFPNDWAKNNNIPYVVAYLSAIKSDKRRPHPKNI